MVLCLKARESRSLPSLPNAKTFPIDDIVLGFAAGWSSPVARQAHNLKVVGSNPAPATNAKKPPSQEGGFLLFRPGGNRCPSRSHAASASTPAIALPRTDPSAVIS